MNWSRAASLPVRLPGDAPRRRDHTAESVTAVAGEGGVAVSYVPAGSRVSPMAVVLLATSALIFSTGGLFIRKLDHPHAWQTVFWRSLSACVSLGAADHLARANESAARRRQDRAAGLGRRRRLLRCRRSGWSSR